MTTIPVCQWCRQPAQPPVTWWDDQPQCGNPIRCDKRITSSLPQPA